VTDQLGGWNCEKPAPQAITLSEKEKAKETLISSRTKDE
jgi:hypothetical protein